MSGIIFALYCKQFSSLIMYTFYYYMCSLTVAGVDLICNVSGLTTLPFASVQSTPTSSFRNSL